MALRPKRWFQRLRDLVAWQARDRDMQQEMQFHLDSLAREYVKNGMPASDADLLARRRFGSPLKMKEQGHDLRSAGILEEVIRDARHAARRLVRTPGFALPVLLTMALAIGANASIFTIVHRVVLNPLPYPESGRLVDVNHGAALINVPTGMGMKVGLYHHYSDRARTLDGIAIFNSGDATLTGDGEPERVRATRTTTTLAPVLGVSPALGRWFTDEEGSPGASRVAVISHGLWTRRYGGDASVIGRPVTIDGISTDIVGVMPDDYAFPDPRVDVWLPDPVSRATGLGIWTHRGVARLRDGVTVADARAELDALIRDLPQAFPGDPLLAATGSGIGVMSTATTLKEATVGDIEGALWILLAAVGVVLLVAAANVANLFLVRAETRQREVAVRRALGAGGGRIARLFLSEGLLLSIAAGAVGLLLAWIAVRVLPAAAPVTLPRLAEIRLDGVVIVFTFVLSILTALAFGSIPLFGGTQLAGSLDPAGRRTTASRGRLRARHFLMGGQVALALVLVTSSSLMVLSFSKLRAVDPGFEPRSALTFSIGLPPRDYADRDAAVAAHHAILDRISAVAGVTSVSASTCLPLAGPCFGNGVVVEGRPALVDSSAGTVSFRAIAGGLLETMGTRIRRGRGIQRGDVERREPIAVVDETFASLVFPNEDPIGRRVSWSLPPAAPGQNPNNTWLTIVGIASSTPVLALGEAAVYPQLYVPMSLTGRFDAPPWEYIGPRVATMNYVVRFTAFSQGQLSSIRRAIDGVDANLAMAQVSTLEETLDRASAQMGFTMALVTIAAGIALLLGVVGIYGVISYIVHQRTGEIGVRLALGAEPGRIAGIIVRQGATAAIAGIAVGLVVALAGGRLIESLLYGVSPRDPGVFAFTTVALVFVALLACWVPARRAARLNPVHALREE